jgi:hypothetical protein
VKKEKYRSKEEDKKRDVKKIGQEKKMNEWNRSWKGRRKIVEKGTRRKQVKKNEK